MNDNIIKSELTGEEYSKFIETAGKDVVQSIAMEECAELIQAISKMLRASKGDAYAKGNVDHLCEEMVDVVICMRALKQMYGIDSKQINEWISKKESRLAERWHL